MDGAHFDDLVRELLAGASRRGLLQRLSALPLAGGLAAVLLADDQSAAKKRRKKHKKRKRRRKKRRTRRKRKKGRTCQAGACQEPAPACGDVCASGCQFSSIQAAINAAAPFDTIKLCAETYRETIDIPPDAVLTFTGVGDGEDGTILDGQGSGPVVTVASDAAVALQALRITGGNAGDGSGGGINNTGRLVMTDCTVHKNVAPASGGIGGGIMNEAGGTMFLIGGAVSENTAADAGGGIANQGTMTMNKGATVTGNTSEIDGGGIFNSGGTVTLKNGSTVTGNTAGDGGGIFNVALNGGGTSTCDGGSSVSGNTGGDCVAYSGGSCGTC